MNNKEKFSKPKLPHPSSSSEDACDKLPSNFSNIINDYNTLDINLKELCINSNDNYNTLIGKNKKLYQSVIKLTNKIIKMNENFESILSNNEKEKKEMIKKLDSISSNYKLFAESHRKKAELEKKYFKSNETLMKYENYVRLSLNDMFQIFLILNQKIEQDEVIMTLEFIKNELIKNIYVYKNLLNSQKLEDFFIEFQNRAKKSVDKITKDNKCQTNNIKSSLHKNQSDKNFSDIAHSIDINMERLLNTLYKGNKGRNTSNKIVSSKSLHENNKYKDYSIRSVDKTKEVLFDIDIQGKDNIDLNVNQSSLLNSNNIEDDLLQESNKECASQKIIEIEQNKEKSTKEIDSNIQQTNKSIEPKKEPENNSSIIDNINKELMNNNILLESLNLTATAIFDFVATRPEELGFSKGDVIEIEMLEGVWWKGTINGKTGLIPYNYVRIN